MKNTALAGLIKVVKRPDGVVNNLLQLVLLHHM